MVLTWATLSGAAIAAIVEGSEPKDWPADPAMHVVTVRREAADAKRWRSSRFNRRGMMRDVVNQRGFAAMDWKDACWASCIRESHLVHQQSHQSSACHHSDMYKDVDRLMNESGDMKHIEEVKETITNRIPTQQSHL